MTPEEWFKIKEVLQTALEIEPRSRRHFLDSACAGQVSVRCEVESLLLAHEEDQVFLEQPAAVEATDLLSHQTPSAIVGRRVGPYELLEEIGEGGMGAVYRAVRADGMYDKQVAIKLIRGGMSSEFFIARFKNERQILAGLEHPNIARLLDGGVTEENLPYVVLEFVPGVPIDEYCKRRELSTTDRLKLFRTVCSAVQYAHRNLVVHRDLKPGNILVTEDGVPKLLDFGIAKILAPHELQTEAESTLTVMRIMTPDFASPEQVRGDQITTSSDIYSLGVILYVLLTGQRPYHVSSSAPLEIIKAVCDTEPERPSAAVVRSEKPSKRDEANHDAKTAGGLDLDSKREQLGRSLAGDLDNIVLKALRKEPERRYATVEQLSEDVRRHLEHLPVIARKDTPGYLASKFIQRHKAGFAAALALALTLIAGLVTTLREARIARMERARAEHRFNEVRKLANSLMFEVHDSIRQLPGATAARKLIIQRAQEYLDSLAQEAKTDPSLLRELAAAYARLGDVQGHAFDANLGDTPKAIQNYRKATELLEATIPLEPADRDLRRQLANSYHDLALALSEAGDHEDSEHAADQAVHILTELIATQPDDIKSSDALANMYLFIGGDFAGKNDLSTALQFYEKALATFEQLGKSEPQNPQYQVQTSFALKHVGSALALQNQLPLALDNYRAALAIDEAQLALHPENFPARYNITYTYSDTGYVLRRQGNLDAALSYYRRALDIRLALSVADPLDAKVQRGLGNTYEYIGGILMLKQNFAGALASYKKTEAIREALAQKDPVNENHRFELADAQAQIGNLYAEMALRRGVAPANQLMLCRSSESWLQKALPTLLDKKAKNRMLGEDFEGLTTVTRNVEACRATIAQLSRKADATSN